MPCNSWLTVDDFPPCLPFGHILIPEHSIQSITLMAPGVQHWNLLCKHAVEFLSLKPLIAISDPLQHLQPHVKLNSIAYFSCFFSPTISRLYLQECELSDIKHIPAYCIKLEMSQFSLTVGGIGQDWNHVVRAPALALNVSSLGTNEKVSSLLHINILLSP